MSGKKIVLRTDDFRKLQKIITLYKLTNRLRSKHLIQLSEELEQAIVIDSDVLPPNIVTMYSRVRYKNLNDSMSYEVTVVFPSDTDKEGDRISVLAPLGTALIGEEEKNITHCYAPAGDIPLEIEKVLEKVKIIN